MRPLKFHHDFWVEVVRGEGVLLLSERDHYYLSGNVYELLAPLLDGRYTEDQIIDRLESKAPLAELYYGLEMLKQKRYVIETDANAGNHVAAFWDGFVIDSRIAERKLTTTAAKLQAFGNINLKELISALRSVGVKTKSSGFSIVVTDDYLRLDLIKWNRTMLRKELPWMILKPVGSEIWLGPIFVPQKTGCWECLAQRLSANREVEEFVQRKRRQAIAIPKFSLQSTRTVAANLAVTEILRWLVEEKNDRLEGKVVTLDFRTLETRRHVLTRRPQCPACGNRSDSKKATAILLQSSPVLKSENGNYRTVSPEQTILKYQEHISPITGVITKLVRKTPANVPIPLFFAGHNSAIKSRSFYMLQECLRSKSAGKGKSEVYARASAMCEAIERYSGNFTGDETRVRDTYQQLQNEAVHPHELMLYSNHQYEIRKEWNARNSAFQFIPEPFDPNSKIHWSPAWSLTRSQPKYVPTAYCYYGFSQKSREKFCFADSNGNASGNTMEEAILQGFLELVERDSVAIWWYNRLARSGVDLNSFHEPYYDELKKFYASISREFWVLDLTTDLNIPSFAAISRRGGHKEEEIVFGFGAHFDAKIAVLRAITEMGQLLPRFTPPRDGSIEYDYDDPDAIDWWRNATIEKNPYLMPDASRRVMTLDDYPDFQTDDLREDVLRCVQIVQNHGMEMLVLDQTRPDIGMPVVKVMVPGLRHFWARFAPGRLYDVPVQQGWLKKRKRESELNPILVFV